MVSAAPRAAREPPDDRPESRPDDSHAGAGAVPGRGRRHAGLAPVARAERRRTGRDARAARGHGTAAGRAAPARPAGPALRGAAAARRPGSRSNGVDPVRARGPRPGPVVLHRTHARVRAAADPVEPGLADHAHRHRPVGRAGVDASRIAMTDATQGGPAAGGWEPGDGSAADRMSLADWRRRITTLYAEVRAMAATDPAAA